MNTLFLTFRSSARLMCAAMACASVYGCSADSSQGYDADRDIRPQASLPQAVVPQLEAFDHEASIAGSIDGGESFLTIETLAKSEFFVGEAFLLKGSFSQECRADLQVTKMSEGGQLEGVDSATMRVKGPRLRTEAFDTTAKWKLSLLLPGQYTATLTPRDPTACRAENSAVEFVVKARPTDEAELAYHVNSCNLLTAGIKRPLENVMYTAGQTLRFVRQSPNRWFTSSRWTVYRDGAEVARFGRIRGWLGVRFWVPGHYEATLRTRTLTGVEQDLQTVRFKMVNAPDTGVMPEGNSEPLDLAGPQLSLSDVVLDDAAEVPNPQELAEAVARSKTALAVGGDVATDLASDTDDDEEWYSARSSPCEDDKNGHYTELN